MNPYPRRVAVVSGYNAKAMAWYAMDDNNRELVGYGRTEENAVSDLYALIRDREADEARENDRTRWEEYETEFQRGIK